MNDGKPTPFPAKTRIAHDDVVYYIQFGDRIKIGTTSDLRSRMRQLPVDALLATEAGGRDVERQRHEQFAADLVAGREWFTPSQALLDHIATLQRRPNLP